MASTNVPSSEEVKKVRIQCRTPDDGVFDFDIEKSRFEELLTTLVDCKYKLDGCITNDYVKDIKEHEGRCQYRKIRCPIQSKEDLCEDILAKNLVEHVTEHHNSDCLSTEENSFSVPIDFDVEDGKQLSKMVTIRDDILLFHLKSEDRKLRASLLFLKNTNNLMNCEITLMADDVKWNNQKFQISSFNEDNAQSAVFDLEKLIRVRNVFSGITVRVECNVAAQQNIAQSDEVFQKIICACCGGLLTSVYYECEGLHIFCKTCYDLKDCYRFRHNQDMCYKCSYAGIYNCVNDKKLRLTLIDSAKEYLFPCENQSLGCKQYIPRFSSNHELLCPFKVIKCHKCEFTGKYAEFISHLHETHTNDTVNSNVYNVDVKNGESCYMLAFGSVFLCSIKNKRACNIEWISTSDITHYFIFEVTFNYGSSKKIVLNTNSDPGKVSYSSSYYRCVYNTVKKTASLHLRDSVICDTDKISFTIRKK